MASTVQKLTQVGLINPPNFLPNNTQYETMMGSVAYGVSSDTSDCDIYGFCIPPKNVIFPHLSGEILGFGRQIQRFEQYQKHHIRDPDALGGKGRSYDFAIYNIVKFFQLCMENNPNMVDSLFTPINCVLHSTKIGDMVRENRQVFIHKGAWHKFKGYAYSQLHKIRTREQIREGEAKILAWEEANSKGEKVGPKPKYRSVAGKRRANIIDKGYDTKFAYHVVRLLDEVEQILETGDLDLQRAKEHMKAVRRGEVPLEEIKALFEIKQKELEKLYHNSKLPKKPNEETIKNLLINCLEEHYGSLEKAIVLPDRFEQVLREISEIANRTLYGNQQN